MERLSFPMLGVGEQQGRSKPPKPESVPDVGTQRPSSVCSVRRTVLKCVFAGAS